MPLYNPTSAGTVADGSITSAKILDGTIATADIASGAVTSALIADGTITTTDISTTSLDARYAVLANNLSDVTAASARTNLGLGTAALISSTAGGDLSGTLPSPTVAKVNGVSVTGTPVVGNVLTATGASAATWQAPPQPQMVVIGSYLDVSGGHSNAAFQSTEAVEYGVLIFVPSTMTFDRIAYQLNTVGASGCVVRLGIRNATLNSNTPGAVVLDAGTDDATTNGAGQHTITINQQLTSGYYWLTAASQGTPATTAKFEVCARPFVVPSTTAYAQGRSAYGVGSSATVSGALPGTYPLSGTTLDGASPWLAIRRSA